MNCGGGSGEPPMAEEPEAEPTEAHALDRVALALLDSLPSEENQDQPKTCWEQQNNIIEAIRKIIKADGSGQQAKGHQDASSSRPAKKLRGDPKKVGIAEVQENTTKISSEAAVEDPPTDVEDIFEEEQDSGRKDINVGPNARCGDLLFVSPKVAMRLSERMVLPSEREEIRKLDTPSLFEQIISSCASGVISASLLTIRLEELQNAKKQADTLAMEALVALKKARQATANEAKKKEKLQRRVLQLSGLLKQKQEEVKILKTEAKAKKALLKEQQQELDAAYQMATSDFKKSDEHTAGCVVACNVGETQTSEQASNVLS